MFLKLNDSFPLCLPTTVQVEYLQITASVQHIVSLLTTHNKQKMIAQYNRVLNRLCYNTMMTAKQVGEQRSLEGSHGPD